MVRVYGSLAVLGAVIPLSAFLPWVAAHGIDPAAFAADLFVNRVSTFFGLDVIVSAAVVLVMAVIEHRRIGLRHIWMPVVATCLIGVSCGLPLLLALRERAVGR